jgi:hypothetical protein
MARRWHWAAALTAAAAAEPAAVMTEKSGPELAEAAVGEECVCVCVCEKTRSTLLSFLLLLPACLIDLRGWNLLLLWLLLWLLVLAEGHVLPFGELCGKTQDDERFFTCSESRAAAAAATTGWPGAVGWSANGMV